MGDQKKLQGSSHLRGVGCVKTLKGKAYKISYPIVGRIEMVKSDETGITHLLKYNSNKNEYALLRSGSPKPGVFVHPSLLLDTSFKFSEGDILRLSPNGECQLLYEQQSLDNAILVTERCNCRCLMCPQPPQKDLISLQEEVLELLRFVNPSPIAFGITGGEPTCVFDDLITIIECIRQWHPTSYTQILTNARVLSDFSKTEKIHEIAGKNATFCVPVYSDDDVIHDYLVQSNGAFWQTIEGLLNLGGLGANVEVRIVVLAHNYKRLPQWAEFIYRNSPFVSHVAIMGLEPIGLARENIDTLWIDPADYIPELLAAVRTFHQRGIPVSIYNHQLCTLPKQLWRFVARSISSWKVRFDNRCAPCSVKDNCGGFFFSATDVTSRNIHAI